MPPGFLGAHLNPAPSFTPSCSHQTPGPGAPTPLLRTARGEGDTEGAYGNQRAGQQPQSRGGQEGASLRREPAGARASHVPEREEGGKRGEGRRRQHPSPSPPRGPGTAGAKTNRDGAGGDSPTTSGALGPEGGGEGGGGPPRGPGRPSPAQGREGRRTTLAPGTGSGRHSRAGPPLPQRARPLARSPGCLGSGGNAAPRHHHRLSKMADISEPSSPPACRRHPACQSCCPEAPPRAPIG